MDFQGKRIFKQRITSLCLIEIDPEKDKVELELYQAVTDYVSNFYDLASRHNDRIMMFLLLIYQRMVSSSSKAILLSLSRRLEKLQGIKSGIIELENKIEEIEEGTWDELSDKVAEDQLLYLERNIVSSNIIKDMHHLDMEIVQLKKD
ncbi:MAG: hypothetical protein AB1420_04620 [Bacillota bacterium]